jgi:glycerophosphoryl diester phosphodiesterase
VGLSISSEAETGLPTLDEALSFLQSARLRRIYVELKGRRAHSHALLEAVLSIVRRCRVARSVTLLSLDHSIIRLAKEIAGDIRTAATFPARSRRLISIRSILQDGRLAGVDEVALHYGLATRRAVETLHEGGFSVSAWTANRGLAMRHLVASGVDAIMTDFPNRLREILDTPDDKTAP